jgi:hypothetical protein
MRAAVGELIDSQHAQTLPDAMAARQAPTTRARNKPNAEQQTNSSVLLQPERRVLDISRTSIVHAPFSHVQTIPAAA